MKPYIKKNKPIPLDVPEYVVDRNIAKHLPYPLSWLGYHNFTVIVGKPGAGKSSLISSFLTQRTPRLFRKVYDKIYVFMPKASMNSQKNNIFDVLPSKQIFHSFDEETLEKVLSKIESNSEEELNSLIIIDDMTSHLKRSMYLQGQLKEIVYNRRHLRTTIFLAVQSYVNIPKQVREVINYLFLFKPSKMQFELLFNELFELKRDDCQEIMDLAYNAESPHTFMFLNVLNQRMFRRFDEIIYRDNSESESFES